MCEWFLIEFFVAAQSGRDGSAQVRRCPPVPILGRGADERSATPTTELTRRSRPALPIPHTKQIHSTHLTITLSIRVS